jgi:hypothetical protein
MVVSLIADQPENGIDGDVGKDGLPEEFHYDFLKCPASGTHGSFVMTVTVRPWGRSGRSCWWGRSRSGFGSSFM